MNFKTMIKYCSILICLFSASEFATGANTNELMTKIVYRNITTNQMPESFGTQPTTLYRIGIKYNRIEESPDAVLRIHGLIISDEPDGWMINLMDKSGIHMIDGGPTYEVHDSIVSPPDPNESQAQFQSFTKSRISGFEFGHEMEFLRKNKAKTSGPLLIGRVACDRYELTIDDYAIEMFVKSGTEIPYWLRVTKERTEIRCLQYDFYKADLPPDFSLFKPPVGIKISEARQ